MAKFRLFFITAVLILFAVFTSCAPKEEGEKNHAAIGSLEELANLPQIISAKKLTSEEIASAFLHLGFGTQDTGRFDKLVMYEIVYTTADEAPVKGIVAAPSDYLDKNYPITIRNRGNSNLPKGQEIQLKALMTRGANWSEYGYITLLSNYRDEPFNISSDPFANDGIKHDQWGGDDLNDVIALIDLAETFSFKGDGLFMEGHSRGGMMTYMALRRDDRIDAAIVSAAVADNAECYELWKPMFNQAIGGSPENFPEEYFKRSAVNWADEITTPLLILHGRLDEVVPISQSQRVFDKMTEAGRDVTFKIYEETGHIFDGEMLKDAMEWLEIKKSETAH